VLYMYAKIQMFTCKSRSPKFQSHAQHRVLTRVQAFELSNTIYILRNQQRNLATSNRYPPSLPSQKS
jgi:hypothetical protein